MTILCVGDIHIKPTNTHLIDCLEVQLLQRIAETKARYIVLLGDILDTFERLHTQALNRAYRLIDTLRNQAYVYVLVGNHDLINNQQFLTSEHWMNGLKQWSNVTIVDRVYERRDSHLSMLFVPYVPVQSFQKALDTFTDWDWRNADYIFAHQEFQGCKMGAIESSHGDVWPLDAPCIVSGHIHDYQRPQPNLLYIGASVQNNFGDQTDPRVLCIRGPGQDWVEYPISLPRKKTVYTTLEDIASLETQAWVDDPNIDNVRIVVRGDYEQFKTFVKTERFESLTRSQKCKVVHKPLPVTATTPESTPLDNPQNPQNPEIPEKSFREFVTRKVLQRRDEYLYVAFQQVAYGDTQLDADQILLV
jgi:hypothetical protein